MSYDIPVKTVYRVQVNESTFFPRKTETTHVTKYTGNPVKLDNITSLEDIGHTNRTDEQDI